MSLLTLLQTTVTAPSDAYGAAVFEDQPIAFLRLDEASGAADDYMSPGRTWSNNGTITQGVSGVLNAPGGTAVEFDGVNSGYFQSPVSTALDIADVFTLEAWIKPDTFSGGKVILQKGTGTGRITWEMIATTSLGLYVNGVEAAHTGDVFTAGQPYHVAVTKNGSTTKLYVNGVDQTILGTNNTVGSSGDTWRIGEHNSGGELFDGVIDEVAIYNTALSAARVKAHYDVGASAYAREVFSDSPVAYYRMGEPSGDVLDDMGGDSGAATGSLTRDVVGGLNTSNDDGAIDFDGSTSYVSVPHQSKLNLGNGPMSFEFWIKLGNLGLTEQKIIDKDTTGAYQVVKLSSGAVQPNGIAFGKADVAFIASSTVSLDLDWHHVVITKSGSTTKIYIDAVDRTGTVTDQTLGDTGGSLYIGSRRGGALEFLDGSLDELAIYNTELSSARIAAHYDAGKSTGAQSVSVGLINQAATTFTPTVIAVRNLSVGLINQAAATFTPTVLQQQFVSVGLINRMATASTPTVTSLATVSVGLINQAATAFAPTVLQQRFVSVALINRTATASTPTITSVATVSVGLINRTAATFAPTITTGAAALTVGLINQTAATFAPTVIPGAVNVSVALLSQAASAFAPTVGRNVSVALISQAAATFTPNIGRSLSVGLINQTAVTFTPSVGRNIGVGLVNRTAVASAPTVTSVASISLALINRTAVALAPTIDAGQAAISTGLINQAAVALTPTVTSLATVSVGLINRTATASTPTIQQQQFVGLALIDRTAVAQTPIVTSVASVSFGLIDRTAQAHAPAISYQQFVSLGFVSQTAVAQEPTITTGAGSVVVDTINQAATTFTPTVTTGAATVSVALIDRTAAAFAPTITTGAVGISVEPINQTAAALSPSVANIYTISVGRIDRTATAFSPGIVQAGFISLGRINQEAATFAPAITSGEAQVVVGLVSQLAATFAPAIAAQASISLGQVNQTAAAFDPTLTTFATISFGRVDQPTAAFAPTVKQFGDTLPYPVDVSIYVEAKPSASLTVEDGYKAELAADGSMLATLTRGT
ncbi:MAG TPA: LamG domain-containing protein [Actinomycetes bacterium]|nr:LamG domain-containing protein [Actinomycetes bacterium]